MPSIFVILATIAVNLRVFSGETEPWIELERRHTEDEKGPDHIAMGIFSVVFLHCNEKNGKNIPITGRAAVITDRAAAFTDRTVIKWLTVSLKKGKMI